MDSALLVVPKREFAPIIREAVGTFTNPVEWGYNAAAQVLQGLNDLPEVKQGLVAFHVAETKLRSMETPKTGATANTALKGIIIRLKLIQKTL